MPEERLRSSRDRERARARRHFFEYGEERSARRIARSIVERRSIGALPTTTTILRSSSPARCIARDIANASIRPRACFRRFASPSTTNSTPCATASIRRSAGCAARPRGRHQLPLSRRSHRETEIPRRFPPERSHEEAVTPDEGECEENRAREAAKCARPNGRPDDGSARASRATPSSHRQPAQCESAAQRRVVRSVRGRYAGSPSDVHAGDRVGHAARYVMLTSNLTGLTYAVNRAHASAKRFWKRRRGSTTSSKPSARIVAWLPSRQNSA